jgi:hypothetical protein
MPLLLYCVAPESASDANVSGVGGAAVRSVVEEGLRFFYSEATAQTKSSRDVATAAQQVHAVISDIFSRGAVLPFQYPTVVSDVGEIERIAGERGKRFREFLERTGDKVQMDIRLEMGSAGDAGNPPNEGPMASQLSPGRAYLAGRARCQALLSDAAEKCRVAAHSADWRSQQHGQNIRCQALISRVEVLSFQQRMRTLELPEGVKAAGSGPWPPTGFWEDEPR